MAKINAAWQAASEDMYKAQQQAGGQNPGAGFDPNNMGGNPSYGNGSAGNAGQQGGNPNDNVTDVDYEEVK
jgi:molecular chaperone DnaK